MLVAYSQTPVSSLGRYYSGTATKTIIAVKTFIKEKAVKAICQGHLNASSIRVWRKMPQLFPPLAKASHRRTTKVSEGSLKVLTKIK